MKKRFTLARLFGNNRFLLVFALLSAAILWVIVTLNISPNGTVTINENVVISTDNTALGKLGLKVVSPANGVRTAQVAISGRRYVISQVKDSDIDVTPSFTGVVAAGTYDIELVAQKVNPAANYSVQVNPPVVKVTFDTFSTKSFDVTPSVDGLTPGEGLFAEAPTMNQADQQITIEGPDTVLGKISKVVAKVSLDNFTATKSGSYSSKLQLLDAEGKELAQSDLSVLKLSNPAPKVFVAIYKRSPVSLNPTFSNAPAYFSRNKNVLRYTLSPSEITISGNPSDVDKVRLVNLAPIDFTTIDFNHTTFPQDIVLPGNVSNFGKVTKVTVRMDLAGSGIESRTMTVSKYQFENGPAGLTPSPVTDVYNVELLGPKASIDALTPASVVGLVDLSGETKAGEYGLPVTITVPGSDDIWVYGTYQTVIKLQ